MTERTPLTTYRNSDQRIVYQFPVGTDLSGIVPTFYFRNDPGDTALLTVTAVATPNGSSAVVIGQAVVLTLKIADLITLPDVNVWAGVYDSVLAKSGFVNRFVGGPLTQFVDGSYGEDTFSDSVFVDLNGVDVAVVIEGGNLGAAVGVGLAALNAAVDEATEQAAIATAAAAAATAAVAGVPAQLAGKLDVDAGNRTANILNNLPYLDTGTNAVQRPAYEKLKDWLFAGDFGVASNGTDQTTNLTRAINAAIASGRPLMLPAGTIRVDTAISIALGNYPAWQAAFSTGLVIMGIGQGITVIDSRVVNGYWLSIDSTNPHTSTFQAVLGGYVGKMTIRNSTAIANSSGIKVRACFQFLFEDLQIFDMSGTGFKVDCSAGDLDGSVHVILNRVRIERCDVWCVDAAAINGNNEIGQFAIVDSFIQYGGLDESKTITAITQANPAVVTSTAHGFVNGDLVYICGVTGMTQVDSMVANVAYTVAGATANMFQLAGTNSTAFSPFTAGKVLPRDPKSGGIKWKGQQLRIINGGAVLCNNASLYIPGGSGLAQDVTLQNFTVENPGGFGVLITGLRNLDANILHIYSNQSFTAPNYAGWLLDGQTSQVSNIIINKPCVRATAAETNYVYFKQFGANADLQTNRVRNIDYKQAGFAGQRSVEGFLFDPVPEQAKLVLTATTNVRLVGVEDGYVTSGRRAAPVVGTVRFTTGEVVAYSLNGTGINQANALVGGGALANNTTYQVYLYDATDTLGRWALDINTTAPVYDATIGKMVMTGSPDRIWKGRVRTDGAAQFVVTDTSWLNPDLIAAPVTGAKAYQWVIANGYIAVKTGGTLPSSNTDANYFYKPSVEEIVVYDPASVPANSFIQADITLTNHAANDQILGVSRAGGWGDLTAVGSMKAANVMRLTLFNGTGSPIDLASANIFVEKLKR